MMLIVDGKNVAWAQLLVKAAYGGGDPPASNGRLIIATAVIAAIAAIAVAMGAKFFRSTVLEQNEPSFAGSEPSAASAEPSSAGTEQLLRMRSVAFLPQDADQTLSPALGLGSHLMAEDVSLAEPELLHQQLFSRQDTGEEMEADDDDDANGGLASMHIQGLIQMQSQMDSKVKSATLIQVPVHKRHALQLFFWLLVFHISSSLIATL